MPEHVQQRVVAAGVDDITRACLDYEKACHHATHLIAMPEVSEEDDVEMASS
jgi:hypothetical protein